MKKLLQCLLILLVSLSLVACGDKKPPAEKKKTNDEEKIVDVISLADWEGEWNSIDAYLDDENLEESFKELAEREKITVDEAKKEFAEKRLSDIKGLIIKGDKVTFLDDMIGKGKSFSEANYKYVESKTIQHGTFETEWAIFKAESDDAKYPYLLLMPIHGEEALIHFHLRYGNDADSLLEKESWYPTLIKPDSSYSQIHEEITE